MKPIVKQSITHIAMIALFLVLSCVYFYPVLEGKVIAQGDIQKAEAMAAEQKRVAAQTGEMPVWNSAMFSGMPAYQISTPLQKSIFTPLRRMAVLADLGFERNIGVLFLYFIGFYVGLLALGVSPWLALLGAVAFGLGSYNIIIIEAGHITKAWAIAMILPILSSMVLVFRGTAECEDYRLWKNKKVVWGFILFVLALGMQISYNHIQITFYTIIGAFILGIAYFINSIRRKYLGKAAVGVGILLLGCVLAFGGNIRHLLVNQQYAKQTMRGGSELTITPDGEKKQAADGLDVDYAFAWSYGIGETYTLLVPGAYGGGSAEKVGRDSECYRTFRQTRMPLYWGEQPFTSGPVYFGAIIIFLFILGLIVVRGPECWWLLAATLLAIAMSWGKNLLGFNEWIFNVLPLYNKFRTPSMSLVLANVCMVTMAVLALHELLSDTSKSAKQKRTPIYIALGITVGILLLGLLLKGAMSFSGASDRQMAAQYGSQWSRILEVFVADRKALFTSDSWRSVLFVVLSAAVLLVMVTVEKIPYKHILAPAVLMVLVLIDLWGIDRRYLTDENFVSSNKVALRPSAHDKEIDSYAAQYGDNDYRVFDLSVNTFNDSQPSAFHHQIGGYSAAKLRRYQDLIDFHLSRKINMDVLDMLNAKYIVTPQGIQRNASACGNAWFVSNLRSVDGANEEILALNDFLPRKEAIVDAEQWKDVAQHSFVKDEKAQINMVHDKVYNPEHLTYHYVASTEQLAVFSEIFYKPDWFAYIDGQRADYFRVNYVLRAMFVPAGEHTIEFINEAPLMHYLDKWSIAFSVLICLVVAGALLLLYQGRVRLLFAAKDK